MAELREVIIGNIRLTLTAGPSPRDRQIMIRGEATIYEQNITATRSHTSDLTATASPEDQAMYAGMIDRFIQSLMVQYEIDQADLNEGQAILDAAAAPAQPQAAAAPLAAPAPPIPPPVAQPASHPGEGQIVAPPTTAPTEPVATLDGEGALIAPPVEEPVTP